MSDAWTEALFPGVPPDANPYGPPAPPPSAWTGSFVAGLEDELRAVDTAKGMFPDSPELSRRELAAIEGKLRAAARAHGVQADEYLAALRAHHRDHR